MPKRKKPATANSEDEREKTEPSNTDLSHSVLGGLKDPTLNSRVSGTETEDDIMHLSVPFGDKNIVCERHDSSKKDGDVSLIFTHGAGGGIANPATRDFAIGFGAVNPMISYQGTMNLQNRVKGFHAVIDDAGGKVGALGGRSMGARAAVLTALEIEKRVKALVLVSWPLLTGKGEREVERRERILMELPENMDVLFVLGTEDKQCPLGEFDKVMRGMKAKTWIVEVQGADHGMSLKQKDGVQSVRRESGALAARWLMDRPQGTYCSVEWDRDESKVVAGEWRDAQESRQNKARRVE